MLPKTAIGKALHYLANRWRTLTVFVTDSCIPLNDNQAVNAIRPFATSRRNWLFSQTPRGTYAIVRIYNLIETARTNGIEPYTYMVKVLTKLP
jgi:transposase